ncbi:hypothetical protein ScPMuIL_006549 [Solemya velum]
MCILFLHLDDSPPPDGYKLILANNRDEGWDRPTKPMAFWDSKPDCISSLDMQAGREGGTWLAVSKKGRVGSLLSILAYVDPTKKGRGFLARDFITSDKDMNSYLKDIAARAEEYNNFNLVLADLESNTIGYVNSKTKTPEILPPGSYVISNSPMATPWQKAINNRAKFSDLVKNYGVKSEKNNLVASLFSVLKDKTQYPEDQLVRSQGVENGLTEEQCLERSACFVWSPSLNFATITNSVVLVDADGNCEYIERNLKNASTASPDPDSMEWNTDEISFHLDCSET